MNNPEQTAKVRPTALFPMALEDLSESCQAVRYFPTIRRLSYGSSIVVQNVGKLRPRSRQISVVVRPSVMNPRKCLEIKMTVIAKLGLCLVTINPGFSVHKCPNSSPNEDTLSTAAAVWTRRMPAPSAGTAREVEYDGSAATNPAYYRAQLNPAAALLRGWLHTGRALLPGELPATVARSGRLSSAQLARHSSEIVYRRGGRLSSAKTYRVDSCSCGQSDLDPCLITAVDYYMRLSSSLSLSFSDLDLHRAAQSQQRS